MALKAKYQTSPFVFTGNPIILESEGYPTDRIKGGKFTVSFEGRPIYEGRFFSPLNIDIAEIVDAAGAYFAEPAGDSGTPLERIEEVDPGRASSRRKVSVLVDYNGNDEETFEMLAIPGGIPSRQFRFYATHGKDVFDSRLYGREGNIFFTSRTTDWLIELKETELYPLYFMATTHSMRITLRECTAGNELYYEVPGGICTLDLDAVRREFLDARHILSNVFDLFVDNNGAPGFCCRLAITHCSPSRERYRLKFRNSFGVFEIMELAGTLLESTDVSDSEEYSYRKLDPVTRRFSNFRERLEATRSFSITVPVERNRGSFIADMLCSEEIYLLDATKLPVRVNVTSDEFQRRTRQEAPEFITLKIECTDPDSFFGNEISGISDSQRPRIFSDEFTEEFN